MDELIETVGLGERAAAKIASLSGGERRRLDVAIGIIGRPQVLFLDEPTAGLDPIARRGFHDLIHHLSDLEDTTILLTTHDLDEAEKLADRILILDRGRIVADGSAEALSRRVSGRAEVRWSRGGEHFVHATSDATGFVRELFAQHGDAIADLEVRRASLEDTCLAMIHRQEASGHRRVRGGGGMNPTLGAVRIGLGRGWTEFRHSLTRVDELMFNVLTSAVILIVLYFQRDNIVAGTSLSLATVTLPSVVGMLVAFSATNGAAFVVAFERARSPPFPVGLVLAPVVLRRMARRESGASVEAGRLKASQRIG